MNETSGSSDSLQFFLSQNEEKLLHLDLWGEQAIGSIGNEITTDSRENISLITLLKAKAGFDTSSVEPKDVSDILRSEWLHDFQEFNKVSSQRESTSGIPLTVVDQPNDTSDTLEFQDLNIEEPSMIDYRWTNERLKSKELRIDNFMTDEEPTNRNQDGEVEDDDENIYIPSFVSQRIFPCFFPLYRFYFQMSSNIPASKILLQDAEETVVVNLEDEETDDDNERKHSIGNGESEFETEDIEILEFEKEDDDDAKEEHHEKTSGDELALLKVLMLSHFGNEHSSISNRITKLKSTDIREVAAMFTYPSFQPERTMTDVEEFTSVIDPEAGESE
jgi:hypothetical protein